MAWPVEDHTQSGYCWSIDICRNCSLKVSNLQPIFAPHVNIYFCWVNQIFSPSPSINTTTEAWSWQQVQRLHERFESAVNLVVEQRRPSRNEKPGAPFAPGEWPTPELSLTPVGRYAICTSTEYTSETIQHTLDSLGPSSTLYLPASTVWNINSPIALRENKELATWGYPTNESQMARLEAGKECYPHVINARAITGATLRNVVVDGGEQKYGYEPKCGVMSQSVIMISLHLIRDYET